MSCCVLGKTFGDMGTYLSKPKTEKVSEDGENQRLRYGLSSMQGWRSSMEDAHAAIPDLDSSTSFFAVYDGHGGKVVAKFCAKFLHKELLTDEGYVAGDLSASVRRAFLRMDEIMCGSKKWRELIANDADISEFDDELYFMKRKIEDDANQDASNEDADAEVEGPSAGCTACAVVIRDKKLVIANAGDSRCVMSRGGQAYDLSRDHKPELEAEQERILKAGGFIHAGRVNGTLNLARAIGDMEFKHNKALPAEEQIVTANPEINTIELSDDDEFIVIACDGIWDCMSSQELVDFVREQLNSEAKLSAVCERTFDRCLAPSVGGEGCDNMTMILVQFKKPTASSSASGNKSLPSDKASSSS
ncbi:hypothetical protein Cgig2_005631 [Carnegiea gigantea]|uniref:protein-serine/threonine phosphatase n=1 Tax=Carnegiea gigantea TaxID=171969 RepID=A0A9Q1QPR2_9CARY|nr:hypothetical protein Cgig2_005631 [Carnegiea gigantea]